MSVLAGGKLKHHKIMKNLKNILRCYAMGMGLKSISTAFEVSRNTVRKYVRRYQESGLSIERLLAMPESQIIDMFVDGVSRSRTPSPRQEELDALLPDYLKRLSRKGVTVKSLYEEYASKYPDGYSHTSFKRRIRHYKLEVKAIGHVEHLAGDQMYIDFAGDKLEVVDELTGEVQTTETFVAVLPCSHMTYCEAVWSQKKEDLIAACENAMHYFGGAPIAIVPDNLKSAVTRSDRHEPVINEEFAAFAEFYNCAVFPARPRHPKDKALVENAVKLIYRSIYKDVEGLIFHDLDSLNAAILKSLDEFNSRKMSGRGQSRKELFVEMEKDYLQPLPALRYQMRERKTATVMRNSYVTLNKHHYSVPIEYIGKRVEIIYDADTLQIFYGMKLITTHTRDDRPHGYTRKESHNLPGRHGSYEKDLDEIYQRAATIDNIVLTYLKEVAELKKYPPLAFRACKGIMSLERKYSLDRLVAACACASQGRRYGFNEVKEILDKGEDIDFLSPQHGEEWEAPRTPAQHKNIRGRDYFAPKSNKKN